MNTVEGCQFWTETTHQQDDNAPSVTTAMLIHDSAIGIKELKFELGTKVEKKLTIQFTKGRRGKYLAVVVANTPPMNAHVP